MADSGSSSDIKEQSVSCEQMCTIISLPKSTDGPIVWKALDLTYDPNETMGYEKLDGIRCIIKRDKDNQIEGMNEFGVCFARAGYVLPETISDLSSRTRLAEKILKSRSAKEATGKALTHGDGEIINGNYIIADKIETYVVEYSSENIISKKVTKPTVRTNHSIVLTDAPANKAGSSELRLHEASDIATSAKSANDLIGILVDTSKTKPAPEFLFRCKGKSKSHTAVLFIPNQLKALYWQKPLAIDSEWQEFLL